MVLAKRNNGAQDELGAEAASLEAVREKNIIRLGQLTRQDGLIAEAIDKSAKQGLGVIQSVLTANDDEEERQILKHALWKDQEQRVKYVRALSDCRLTRAVNGRQTILDLISANSAGDNGWLILQSYHALNHTSYTLNDANQNRRRFFGGKSDNSPTNNGPLG